MPNIALISVLVFAVAAEHSTMKLNPSQLASFDYQVFGVVQGVHFRYYTNKIAEKLHLVGWVQNTQQDTVIGTAQGKVSELAGLCYWLEKVGSPHSSISKLELKNCRLLDKLEFSKFQVNKSYADVRPSNEPESASSREIEAELRELGKLKFASPSKDEFR